LSDLGGKASKCGLSFAASVEASFILSKKRRITAGPVLLLLRGFIIIIMDNFVAKLMSLLRIL
jgi:hypothetical protein